MNCSSPFFTTPSTPSTSKGVGDVEDVAIWVREKDFIVIDNPVGVKELWSKIEHIS